MAAPALFSGCPSIAPPCLAWQTSQRRVSSDWHNAMLALSLGLPKHVVFPTLYAPPTALEAAEAGITENDAEANGRSARGGLVPPVDVSASGARYWRGMRVPTVLYRPPIPKAVAKAASAGGGGDKEEDDGGGDEEGPDEGVPELAAERGGAEEEDEGAPATSVKGAGSNSDGRGSDAAQATGNIASNATAASATPMTAAVSLGSVKPIAPARVAAAAGTEHADGGGDADEGAEDDGAEVEAAPVPRVAATPPSRNRGEARSRLAAEPKSATADDRVGGRPAEGAGNAALRGDGQGPRTGAAAGESPAHAGGAQAEEPGPDLDSAAPLPPRREAPAPPLTGTLAAGTRHESPPLDSSNRRAAPSMQHPPEQRNKGLAPVVGQPAPVPKQPPTRPPPRGVAAAPSVSASQMRPAGAAVQGARATKAGDEQGGEVAKDDEEEEGQREEGPLSRPGGTGAQAGAKTSMPVRGPTSAAAAPLVPPPLDAALPQDLEGRPDTEGIDSPPAEEGGAEGLGGPDDLDGPGVLGGDDGGGDAAASGSWAQPQGRKLLRWRAPRRRLLATAVAAPAAAATPTATPGPPVDPSSTPEGQTRCFRRLAITGASGYLFGDVRTASMFRVAALRSAGLNDQPPFVGPGMNAFFREHLPPKRGALPLLPQEGRVAHAPRSSRSAHHRPEGWPPAQHGERGGGEAAAGRVRHPRDARHRLQGPLREAGERGKRYGRDTATLVPLSSPPRRCACTTTTASSSACTARASSTAPSCARARPSSRSSPTTSSTRCTGERRASRA